MNKTKHMHGRIKNLFLIFFCSFFLFSCATDDKRTKKTDNETNNQIQNIKSSDNHLNNNQKTNLSQNQTPPNNSQSITPTANIKDEEKYNVVVQDVPLKEVLLALAKDADLKLDIGNNIKGNITLTAKQETLGVILERIAQIHPIRYEIKNKYVKVIADNPFYKNYYLDYVNITRTSKSAVSLETQIGAVGFDPKLSAGNNSNTTLNNISHNDFWNNINDAIANIINDKQKDKQKNNGKTDYKNIFINPEAGMVSVKTNTKNHQKIGKFITEIMQSVNRQVLIEATIIEVELSDSFQAGVDWSRIRPEGQYVQSLTGTNLSTAPYTLLKYAGSDGVDTATIKALAEFGDIKVLSNPKITALNNQMAIMKVVDNKVYFTTSVQVVAGSEKVTQTLFETRVHTVPVGFVMQLIAHINNKKNIMINLRPTISRIVGYINDPNPQLSDSNVQSKIPEIQVREFETMLRIQSGDTVVLGGLMQDKTINKTSGVPLLSKIPYLGALFRYSSNQKIKTELLIFLKPTVY